MKLGVAGRLRGVDVDTSHFTGNFPEAFSLDVAWAPAGATLETLGTSAAPWAEVVAPTALAGDAHNLVAVRGAVRATHLRLNIHPDGGVARLRAYGEVEPDSRKLAAGADLAALENGGLVVASSDSFFSSARNLLMPGRSTGMHDGWETKRSRRPAGFDWVVVRLGARGTIARAVVDTSHFRGNYPDRASLEIADAPLATREDFVEPGFAWRPLLGERKLAPDAEHVFESELLAHDPGTHVRLKIHPDGGVARLRLFGRPAPGDYLRRLNAASREDALSMLTAVCGGGRFSSKVEERRPFATEASLAASVSDTFEESFSSSDWLEAFAAHPRLGDRRRLRARGIRAGRSARGAAARPRGARFAQRRVREALRPHLHRLRVGAAGCRAPRAAEGAPRERAGGRARDRGRGAAEDHAPEAREAPRRRRGGHRMRSPITTHVLDLGAGRPREGIRIFLRVKEIEGKGGAKKGAGKAAGVGATWREIGRGVTDADGRVENLLKAGARIAPGTYSLTFEVPASPARSSPSKKSSSSLLFIFIFSSPFFPEITITFVVTDPAAHYHVPLLLSPYGYSTYRGS